MLGGLSLEWSRVEELPPRLHLLLDASASMSLPDSKEGKSRYEVARELVSAMERKSGDLDLQVSAFAEGLLRGGIPEQPEGNNSDLLRALQDLPRNRGEEALLLFSDGQTTSGELWSYAPRRPIYSLAFGDSTPPADLRLEEVKSPGVLHRGQRAWLQAKILRRGEAARSGRYELLEDGQVLDSGFWQIGADKDQASLEIPLLFEKTGSRFLELRIQASGPDARKENNLRLLKVEVIEEELKVLVLAGKPDWDLPFLLAALRGEESLKVEVIRADASGGIRSSLGAEPFDAGDQHWHALILHSLNASWPRDLLEQIDLRGGFLMMAPAMEDRHSLSWPASWGPLPRREKRLEESPALRWHSPSLAHPALAGIARLGLEKVSLPPLEGRDRFPGDERGILLHEGSGGLLIARNWSGRSQAFLSGEGLWRWSLQDKESRELVGQLVSGVLRWLARENPPERIHFPETAGSWEAGLLRTVQARVYDEDYRALHDASLRWSLFRGDSLLSMGEFRRPGRAGQDYEASIPGQAEGPLELRLEASDKEGGKFHRTLSLRVLPNLAEWQRTESSPATLRYLSRRSGGELLATFDADSLLKWISLKPSFSRKQTRISLWKHPSLFLLFLGLLGLEWGLRKRHGMI
ncbi:MAG: hypothetical protein QGG33_02650 [Candidatus Krumholzibacteria bacterium]|nr:hypothetical protein [Candidatus Krumholzibacteria bacterium]